MQSSVTQTFSLSAPVNFTVETTPTYFLNSTNSNASATMDNATLSYRPETSSMKAIEQEDWSPVYKWVLPSISIVIFIIIVIIIYHCPSPRNETRNFLERIFCGYKIQKDEDLQLQENRNKDSKSHQLLEASSSV